MCFSIMTMIVTIQRSDMGPYQIDLTQREKKDYYGALSGGDWSL